MELVCPHCLNALDLGEHPPTEEILCPVCGSSFRLEPLATTDYRGRDDRGRLGKYELIDTVGAGAFGTVYMARDIISFFNAGIIVLRSTIHCLGSSVVCNGAS